MQDLALDAACQEQSMDSGPVETCILDDGDPYRTCEGRFRLRPQPDQERDQCIFVAGKGRELRIFREPEASTVNNQSLWFSSNDAQNVVSFRVAWDLG